MLLPERPLVDDADQVLLPKEAQDVLQGCTLDISPFFKEVVLLHKPSKSLLMADAIWRVSEPAGPSIQATPVRSPPPFTLDSMPSPRQVESQRWRETIVAEVGWGLFGVRGRASFPYPFYLPSRKKKEVQGFVDQVLRSVCRQCPTIPKRFPSFLSCRCVCVTAGTSRAFLLHISTSFLTPKTRS
jgi:hypothetical protein